MIKTRLEHDLLGEREVPMSIIMAFRPNGEMHSLACIKKAAALTNLELGLLPDHISQAIALAWDNISRGELVSEFVVDVIQGGAGTSKNKNVNEVIANRALEHLGLPKARYDVLHPLNLVNL